MSPATADRLLRLALRVVALVALALYPLTVLWPSGWAWAPAHAAYQHMIVGLYATLGVFLLWAAREPARHRSLLWFTVWSSVVHAGVMAAHALGDPGEIGHLWGDVPALLLAAGVLVALLRATRPGVALGGQAPHSAASTAHSATSS